MITPAKPGLLLIATVALLALATDAEANQISTAPTIGRPAVESTEAARGGPPEAAPQPAPVAPAPATAPATAPAISSSAEEARLQATTRRDRSGDGAQNVGVAESTGTAQGIWQIQISSCKDHCRGVSQVQTAKQLNRTQQILGGTRHLTGARRQSLRHNRSKPNGGPTPTARRSTGLVPASSTPTGLVPIARDLSESGKPGLTQIQLGCLSHCFGTTTRTSPLSAQAHGQTLQQMLEEIARALPSLRDVRAAEQNTVAQTSHQWQYGSGLGPGQTQTATQVSTTAQSNDVPLTDAARSALGDHVPQLVNQTEQGIWQLQIGCLAFCSETRQVQRAEQSNTTTRSTESGDSSSPPPTSSVNVTTQTVWQVQLGCLMWCFDTEQQQTAWSENSEGEPPAQEAPAGTPPAGAPPAGAPPPAGIPSAGTPPPASPPSRNPCDRSPTPRGCNPNASLDGEGPHATGGPARRSARHANRAPRGGLIVTARSGWTAAARGGHAMTGPTAGAGANAAIYRRRVVRAPVTARRNANAPGPSSSGHPQGSLASRSPAAGMSSAAGSGSDAPVIALVAAIALCALAAAPAFRSEPIPRRRATEK